MSRYLLQFIAFLFCVSSVPKICADDKHITSDLELSAQLVDDSILKGTIVESSFTFHTSYGDLEVPYNEVCKIVNKGNINNIVIEMKNGDVLKGSFYKKYLKINCLLGDVKLFYDYIKMISFSHSISMDKDFERDWRIEFIGVKSWDFSIVDTTLIVKKIIPIFMNEKGSSIWAVVKLIKDLSPVQDFNSIFKYGWEVVPAENNAMQYVKLELYNSEGDIVAGGGYTDSWISYSGTQIFLLGEVKKIFGMGTAPYSGNSQLSLSRIKEQIKILSDDKEILSGQNSDPITRVEIEFGFYPVINNEGTSSFGNLSINKFNLVED